MFHIVLNVYDARLPCCNKIAHLARCMEVFVGQVDINAADYDRRTALHLASSNGHLFVVDYLARHPDININPLDRYHI